MVTRSAVAPLAAASVVALLGLTACASSDSGQADPTATVAVTATDDACAIDESTLSPGQVRFAVTNDGDQVTEVYVYGEGDAIVGEKEDITPGSSVEFTATLAAGSYQVNCKPGQTGAGYRADLTVQ